MAEADMQPLDTVGRLYSILGQLLTTGEVDTDTPLALASDEEGNQILACWAYGIEKFPQVWDGHDIVPAKGAKKHFILWPSHEEVDE